MYEGYQFINIKCPFSMIYISYWVLMDNIQESLFYKGIFTRIA